jgi:glucosamine--fructose-6-phosphate aminotransferase (isomerizing)
MVKEIFEQPRSVENSLRGRVRLAEGEVVLGGLAPMMERIASARRIIICACGTSWHASLVGEFLIETLARIPVEVEYASEFRYRKPVLFADDVIMAISQSGETADTLAAVREAKSNGCLAIGVCNVVGSTIARETDAGVYLHAGPEYGVASTKAFTSQITVLSLIALALAKRRGTIAEEDMQAKLRALSAIPEQIARVLTQR